MFGRRAAFIVIVGLVSALLGGCTTPQTPQGRVVIGWVGWRGASQVRLPFGGVGNTVAVTGQYGGGSTFDADARSITVSTPGAHGRDTVVVSSRGGGSLADALLGRYNLTGNSDPEIKVTATIGLGPNDDNRVIRCSNDPAVVAPPYGNLDGTVWVDAVTDAPPALPVGSATTTTVSRINLTVNLGGGYCYLLPDSSHPTEDLVVPAAFYVSVQIAP